MENIKIIKHIGEGSFGAVFLVRYDEHGGLNALKHTHVKSFKQSLPYRSLREMRSLLEMKHPHIVTLCSVFPYKNRLSFFFGVFSSVARQYTFYNRQALEIGNGETLDYNAT